MQQQQLLYKQIETKTVVWFSDSNEYIVVEALVAKILSLLERNIEKSEILTTILRQIDIPNQQAKNLIDDVEVLLNTSKKEHEIVKHISEPSSFEFSKFYQINHFIFQVDFLSEYEVSLVHPKFAHLEIESQEKNDFHYKVYSNKNVISFSINNEIIGSWNLNEVHFFQGKFSMKLVENMHQKIENEWLGVFHASAISKGKESMLFLGDSGNGKSTSLALLQAHDFTCLADDFVPIDARQQEVYSFPSAISIKKNSLQTLLPIYPELENSAEYHFKKLNKIVRFLSPNNSDYTKHLPCKALVFIKYKKDSDLIVNQISKINAFEQLVPDSWLSPTKENADIFLNWFSNLPCYQLTYSDNQKMIETVSKIFNNEL